MSTYVRFIFGDAQAAVTELALLGVAAYVTPDANGQPVTLHVEKNGAKAAYVWANLYTPARCVEWLDSISAANKSEAKTSKLFLRAERAVGRS